MGGLTDRRPTLTTERLHLEPLTAAHLDHLVELDSDPEVLRFIWGRALSREESLHHGAKRIDPVGEARGIGAWAGFEQGAFVGWWTLQRDPDDDATAELGYRLRRAAWGRGLATEGSRALLDHAFRTFRALGMWTSHQVRPKRISQHFKPTLAENIRTGSTLTVDERSWFFRPICKISASSPIVRS